MTVSVLIPTRFRRLSISKTFASLYSQTLQPDRIILQLKTTNGQEHKLNDMIRDCGTDTFLLLSDDDYLDDTFLEKTLAKMSEADIVYTGLQTFGFRDEYVSPREWGAFKEFNSCWFTTLCKKEVWDKLGGFDESVGKATDYDFWWRAYKAGFKATSIDEPLFHYCLHEGQDGRSLEGGSLDDSIKKVIAKNL